ncbi:hypothetical protein CDAR_268631 [Caerostris darwini]|uniref:Uncharacterized protein n=1 Tax=Caerostris darwini TaxID=1538125 RepID=A0AAV4X3B4_9ARAC|nr:hypothetical protein CDAR_268631 [Caerostris darwini]
MWHHSFITVFHLSPYRTLKGILSKGNVADGKLLSTSLGNEGTTEDGCYILVSLEVSKRGRCSEPDLLLRTFAISIWIIFPDFVLGQCSASECSIWGNCFFPEKGLSSVFGSGSCAPCFMGGTSGDVLLFDKQTHTQIKKTLKAFVEYNQLFLKREFFFTMTNLKKNSRFHCNTFPAEAPRKLTDTEERILGRINKRRELVSLEKPGQDFSSGEWNIPNIRFSQKWNPLDVECPCKQTIIIK